MCAPNRLFSYQSSKCVLQYLPAAIRFEFSHRCPGIRSTDNLTPLRIRNFRISALTITMDDVRYKIGVIRQYHNGKNPTRCAERNSAGGMGYDVDQYGLLVNKKPFEQCPDEIIFSNCGHQPNLLEGQEMDASGIRNRVKQLMSPPCPDYALIEALNENLVPYDLRREGIIPPYSIYVQLQTSFRNFIKHVERVEYKQSVHNAMKYLVWKLFTGRKTISTQNFGFFCEDVIRLPREMRIHTKNLHFKTWETNTIRKLKPLLIPECFPLDSFKTDGSNIEFNNDIIQTSKLLLIRNARDLKLGQIEHSNIRFIYMITDRTEYIALLHSWFVKIPRVGTFVSIRDVYRDYVEAFFKVIESIPFVTIRKIASRRRLHFPRQVLIPLNSYSEIKVYCKSGRNNRKIQSVNMKVQEIRRSV